MNKPSITFELSNQQIKALREIARHLGLTIGRGLMKDEGSIRKLLQNLAAGELVVAFHDYDSPEDIKRDAAYFHGLASRIEREDNALSAAATLRGLAAALEETAKIIE